MTFTIIRLTREVQFSTQEKGRETMKKPILKKVMALSMAATMLCLTACGNAGTQSEAPVESAEKTSDTTAVVEAKQGESDGETVTIGVWAEDEQKRLEAAVDGVEAATGVKVEFIQYPSDSDFWDNIPAQIAAGTAPDLISCTNEHYLQYIDQGLFESLNEYIDSGVLSTENINEVAMNAWNIDGNVYGIPYALNPGIFVVNNDMWNEFGLGDAYPTTWDEVLDICKKVKEEHNMPALCLNVQEYHLTNYALSFGGGWDYGNNIDAPENAQALQFLIDAYKEGYIITPTELGLSWDGAVLVQQSALFSTAGAWYQLTFETEAPDVELKYLAVPKGGNGNGGGTMHTAALVALKNSKHLDAAMKVMQFAFGNENLYKATVEVTSVIPANSEYFDLYREQLPDLAPLVDYLETSQPFAYPTQSKKFADRLISLMQEALMNEESTLTGQEIVTQLAEEFGNK